MGLSRSQRVTVYVDGFNLYYGLISKGWRRYLWLDLQRFAERLLRHNQSLQAVHYFTAKVFGEPRDANKPIRQNTYLEALQTLPKVSIQYGYFLRKDQHCSACGATQHTYEEKMTDVNIAVQLLNDAQDDTFDTAIIVSGDSDLSGPMAVVQQRFPGKRVVAAFPPNRASKRLRTVASGDFTIGRDVFRDSQLLDQVTSAEGYPLTRPTSWV